MNDRAVGPIPLIRLATVADVARIAEANEHVRSAGYSDTGFIVLPLTADGVRDEIENGGVRYAVAEIAGDLVGFAKFSTRSLDGYQGIEWTGEPIELSGGVHIEKLAVLATHRGRGIGIALYLYLMHSHPGALLYTYVIVSPCMNRASVAFHEHLGFSWHALSPYETDNGSWMMERLYVLTNPTRLAEAAQRSSGFLTPLTLDSSDFSHALRLLQRELGADYVTAEQFTDHAEGQDGSTALVWVSGEQTIAGVAIACTAGKPETDAASRFGFEARDDVGCLQTFVVDDDYRRRGGGTALAQQLLEDLRTRGHKQVLMFTWISGRDDTADGIAEGLGFTHLGMLPEYWHEDSLEAGYECPICGNPCRCSVNVWALEN